MIRKLFTVFALLCTIYSNAQVKEKWAVRYTFADTASPWKDTDIGTSVAIDEQNNVYVTGSSMRDGQDIVTIKYNGAGIEQWKAIYNNSAVNGNDAGSALAIDAQGNVYVTGSSNGPGATSTDFITIKYNNSGIKQWEARYFGPENKIDIATQIALDQQGNAYVAGRSEKNGQSFDIVTVKYNNAGIEQWNKRYNGPGNFDDYANSLLVDLNGNVYVAGEIRATGGQTFDFVTIKYNPAGEEKWVKVFNGTANSDDKAKSLAIDSKGNVIVVGSTVVDASATWMNDFLTIKYDSAGNEIWRKKYNGPGNSSDGAVCVKTDAIDNIYVAGSSHSGSGDMDLTVVKYTKDSALLWVSRYNRAGGNTEELKAMTMDASANVYITGSSQGPTGRDYATVKYDSSGTEKWMFRYNGPGNGYDDPWSIAVNSKGVTVVTGASPGLKSATDYATVMYADSLLLTSVSNTFVNIKTDPELNTYPNPFTDNIAIDYSIPEKTFVTIKVYNYLGQQIANLINDELPSGKYLAMFNGTELENGIYFCELRAGSYISTSKLILQK